MKKKCALLLIAAMVCMMLTACGKEDGMTKVKLTEVAHSIFYAPMYVAIEEGIKQGYTEFLLYGSLGGRIEHSIANIQILSKLASQKIKAKLIDQNTIVEVLTEGTYIYDQELNGFLSLFSLSEKSVISLKNLKYELDKKELTHLFPLGIDNEFIGLVSTIYIHQGLVLSIISKKNA